MGLFDGFFWQDSGAPDEDRVVTRHISMPVAKIGSVMIRPQEDLPGNGYIPQRLKVEIGSKAATIYGKEARSFLEQLQERDERYEKMVARWDLGLKTRDHPGQLTPHNNER